jgi:2-methylaconitate cis-trans-isomerase PrpF
VDGIARVSDARRQSIFIEHPVGQLESIIEFDGTRDAPDIQRVGFVRTARRIMQGQVFVPESVWAGNSKKS